MPPESQSSLGTDGNDHPIIGRLRRFGIAKIIQVGVLLAIAGLALPRAIELVFGILYFIWSCVLTNGCDL
jgi:hypothetical protein